MRVKSWVVALLLSLAVAPAAYAQRLTGTIHGKVTDASGLVVPGVTVTVAGRALIRAFTDVTTDQGLYHAINLPPGAYTLTATLQGFETVRVEGIVVTVGTNVEVNLTMKPAGVVDSVNVVARAPTVDLSQTKNAQELTSEALKSIPLVRDPLSAIQLAPAVVGQSVQGSSRNEMAYLIDGINQNAPDQGYAEANINWDIIEQMELTTTGNPAESYGVVGGALNIVTKSGGNIFSGTGQYYYTNHDLAKSVVAPEYLKVMNVGTPTAPIFSRDASFTLGGPIKKDRIWFFGSYKYLGEEVQGSFSPITIWGKEYTPYNAPYRQDWGSGKATAQLTDNMRAFVMYNYTKGDRPHDMSVPYNRTLDATRHWRANQGTLSSDLTWLLSSSTFLDARFGFWRFNFYGTSQPGTENNPRITDSYTSYQWGSWGMHNGTVKRNYNGSVKVMRYVNNLKGSHEMKAGLELQHGYGSFIYSSQNSMIWRVWNQNPYYYRGMSGLNAPDPVFGDGYVSVVTPATFYGGSYSASTTMRYGGFVQDIWRVNDRLTLNLGLRYDLTRGDIPPVAKYPADAFAQAMGATYIEPVYGINPFGQFQYDGWANPIPWRGFAPQLGLAYKLLGNGKTALKLHWGRYQQSMPGQDFDVNEPSTSATYPFNWWDLNGNRTPDPPPVDKYARADSTNPLGMLGTTWKQTIDPNLKTPYLDEFTGGIDHELATDVRLSVDFVYRNWGNLLSNPYYALGTDQYWSAADSGYWVPFKTTTPAYSGDTASFPAQSLTVYFRKSSSPTQFTRLTNIDGAKARYTALQIAVDKRLSHDWQLGGSVVLSRMAGNYPGTSNNVYGFFQTPNYWTNRDGRIAVDRPVQLKLWGSVMLPYRIQTSYFYTYLSGAPWNRTVTVIPPASWAKANGTATFGEAVNVDVPGAHRDPGTSNVDFRIEKLLSVRKFQLGFFLDAYNLLGFVYPVVAANPAGTWRPADVDTTAGTYSPATTRLTGLTGGTRILKVSARFAF